MMASNSGENDGSGHRRLVLIATDLLCTRFIISTCKRRDLKHTISAVSSCSKIPCLLCALFPDLELPFRVRQPTRYRRYVLILDVNGNKN